MIREDYAGNAAKVTAVSKWANIGTYSESLSEIGIKNNASSQISVSGTDTVSTTYVAANSTLGGELTVVEGFNVANSDVSGNIYTSDTGGFTNDTNEEFEIKFDVEVTGGTQGQELTDLDFFKLDGVNNEASSNVVDSSRVSANVITSAGDLNYDGRVSMKDLAFLNAGKIYAAANSGVASADVDADHDGDIDTDDIAVLSSTWGDTIHGAAHDTPITTTTWTTLDAATHSALTFVEGTKTVGDSYASLEGLDDTFVNSSYDAQVLDEATHKAGFVEVADLTFT